MTTPEANLARSPSPPVPPTPAAPPRDGAGAGPVGAVPDSPAPVADEFPGCVAVHIPRDQIDDYEGRIEVWDAATETAMVVCEPASIYHEHPSQRLAQMTALIALTRGSPSEVFGSADILLRDGHGKPRRIMEADQSVYLNPERDRPPGPSMVVGEDVLPDVVVEVDHTTDARRRKLALYESWGLPEVWVEVPDTRAQSRAASRKPGVTIHVLHPGGYRPSPESRAFPSWTAAEIHRAMNEPTLSVETMAVLERLGRALRERDGTGARDAPLLQRARAAGRAQGQAEGRTEGRAEGRAEQRALLRRQAARRFGARTAEGLAGLLAGIDDPAHLAEVGDWLVVCATGAELLDRCSRPRDPRA